MRTIEKLENRLHAQDREFRNQTIHGIDKIVEARKIVSETLRDLGPPVPSDEIVLLALRSFLTWASTKVPLPLSWMETALVCWGLRTPLPGLKAKTILESEALFASLLQLLDQQEAVGNVTPYLWRGLLNAYLECDFVSAADAPSNWNALRTYLDKSLVGLISETQIKPTWLEALFENHRSILQKTPFDAYRKEVFADHSPLIDSLSEQVDVPETSWFWPGLLLKGVRDLTAGSERLFKQNIDIVLERIKGHEGCHDDGLALILDRYAACESTEPHEGLKKHSVARWRSPTLEKQRNWERVKPEAKLMVQRWLVLEDMRDFFMTLHTDDAMNRRRYEFWMQFLDQMSYVHLVLGKHARASYPELLGSKIGRYSELKGATATNNAFIMRIGRFFFVEFGEVGKCWGYEEVTAKNLIPNFGRVGSISYHELRAAGDCVLINHWGQRDGLSHQGDWEYRFTESLARLGIAPDSMSLRELTERYQLKVSDRRKEGGAIWIRHDKFVGAIGEYLRKSSFQFKNIAEGYYNNKRGVSWE